MVWHSGWCWLDAGGSKKDPFAGTNWAGESYGDAMALKFSKNGKCTITEDGDSESGTYSVWYAAQVLVGDHEELAEIKEDAMSFAGGDFKKTSGKLPIENTKWEGNDGGTRIQVTFAKGKVDIGSSDGKVSGTYTAYPVVSIDTSNRDVDLYLVNGQLVDYLDPDYVDIILSKNGKTGAASKSGNWDKLLDQYEKLVNDYVKLAKKAAVGDLSSLSAAQKLVQQYSELEEKIEKASNDLTSAQSKRFADIAAKALTAMQ
ncbi:MAG: hypothetical protein MdMp014T_2582 [Treponematales bacterium]